MEKYIVKSEDLKGEIKDFPIEIVQRMVECQIEQHNPADVTVFQLELGPTMGYGGFNWDATIEGFNFWCNVINYKEFDLFFEKYPKKTKNTMKTFTKNDLIPGKHIVEFNNGFFAIVGVDMNNCKYLQGKCDYSLLSAYDDNMKLNNNPNWSIKSVYELTTPINIFDITKSDCIHFLKPVWRRNKIKITDILKAFNIEGNEISIELGNTTFDFKI